MKSPLEVLHWFCETCHKCWVNEPSEINCQGCEDENLPSKILPYTHDDKLNDIAESQLDSLYEA